MAFLTVIEGGYPGQILELTENRVVIGRHPSSDIVLDKASVSRHHAQILQSHGRFYLEDLRSRNHTYLNGEKIKKRRELNEADRLKICDMVFEFHLHRPQNPQSESVTSSLAQVRPVSPAPPQGIPRPENWPESLVFDDNIEDSASGTSSIISTLNAKSASHLRIEVKPEVKLRAILDISNALGHTLNLDDVLQRTLDGIFTIFPQADEGFVLLRDFEKNKLVVQATKSRIANDNDSVRVCMTVIRQALADGNAILSHDAQGDTRFDVSESLSKLQIRSMMCVPLVNTQDETLGVIQINTKNLKQQFSQEDLDVLVSVASQVTLAVENARLHDSLLKQRDLERDLERERAEMDLAVQVQLDFLPKEPPEVPGYRFYDFYEAALHVGGDYFDYIALPDGRMAVTLGDVAGKGVPAALLMAKLSSSARFYLLTQPSISDAVSQLNSELASSGLGHRFVTFVVMVIDPETHQATIANAGHLPPLLRSKDGSTRELANEVAGVPLGVLRDQKYNTTTIPLEPGDVVTLYTDGITEAMNPQEQVYGRERLRLQIEQTSQAGPEILSAILRDVEKFTDGRSQSDDICLVCIHRVE
ncbi:MAG: SpoIIE family protein phosphatase [Planctomycetaceae bacterium]